ncbi:hypothetical protein [Paenibacillus wynnii]|uniref:hypothetical protein n=1 Tax=Paenibacillus wynnii TaxID=268407 RepID=UPI0012F7AA77|nr:hypothetical protein [Paenibacillus wynnii]
MNQKIELICIGHFVKENGVVRSMDQNDNEQLHDRCKLAIAEMISGQKCGFTQAS